MTQATQESTSGTLIRRRRILPLPAWRSGIDPVAGTSTTNVDSTVLHLLITGALALQLLVEGEKSTLRVGMDISSSSTPAAEFCAGVWDLGSEERGWAMGGERVADAWGLECVASSPSAAVDVLSGGWVRLGDLVGGRHFNFVGLVVIVVMVVRSCWV